MATINWPSSLPTAPLQDGYKEIPADNTIRSKMDIGPDKVRRRSTSGVAKLSVSYRLTQAQVSDLDTFYRTTTFAGTAEWNYTHPRTGAAIVVRFASPPSYSAFDFEAMATLELEVMP